MVFITSESSDCPHMTIRRPNQTRLKSTYSSSPSRIVSPSPFSPPQNETMFRSVICKDDSSRTPIPSRRWQTAANRLSTLQNRRSGKRVTFYQDVTARLIPSLKYYTAKHLKELYHTVKELNSIRKKLFHEIKIIRENNNDVNGDDDQLELEVCARGLENDLTKEARLARQGRQEACRKCVLLEQEYHQSRGSGCSEMAWNRIAQSYTSLACESVRLALASAEANAREAREYVLYPSSLP